MSVIIRSENDEYSVYSLLKQIKYNNGIGSEVVVSSKLGIIKDLRGLEINTEYDLDQYNDFGSSDGYIYIKTKLVDLEESFTPWDGYLGIVPKIG